MSLVVDASAVVQVLAGDPRFVGLVRGQRLYSPHLLTFEVLNTLRRQELSGAVPPAAALGMVEDLAALDIHYAPARGLIQGVWHLRGSISAYDASYVTLARQLGFPLVTLDARLARAAENLCEVVCPPAEAGPGASQRG